MPPFSSALLPLSLKEIGGLGPTEGNCVSRLPTIMTPHDVTRRQQNIQDDICHLFVLESHFFVFAHNCCLLSQGSEADKVNLTVFLSTVYFWTGWRERQGGAEGKKKKQERKNETDRQSQRDRVQLYFLFTQALFETVGRNRGCIHLFFSTSADPPSSSLLLLLVYSPPIPYFLSFLAALSLSLSPLVSCW